MNPIQGDLDKHISVGNNPSMNLSFILGINDKVKHYIILINYMLF